MTVNTLNKTEGKTNEKRLGVKVGPGPRDLGTLGPGMDSPQSLKVGLPLPFFNEFIFTEYFIAFLSLCLF